MRPRLPACRCPHVCPAVPTSIPARSSLPPRRTSPSDVKPDFSVAFLFLFLLFSRKTVQTCSNGIEGIDANGVVCCPVGCGACAGSGCASRPGGSSECCGGAIKSSGVYCDDSGAAPCIIGSAPPGEPIFLRGRVREEMVRVCASLWMSVLLLLLLRNSMYNVAT